MELPTIEDKTVEIELYKIGHEINGQLLTLKRALIETGLMDEERFSEIYEEVEGELQKTRDAIMALELVNGGGLEELVAKRILPRNK